MKHQSIVLKTVLIAATVPLFAGCVVYPQRPVYVQPAYAPPPPPVYAPAPAPVAPPPADVTADAPAPPPPQAEVVTVAPDPTFIWVPGSWEWRGRWVWYGGHWGHRPRPGVVWVGGHWGYRGPNRVWIAAGWR